MLRELIFIIFLFLGWFSNAAPSPSPNDISPPGGSTLGGTLVTITGSRLSTITSVTISGSVCNNIHIVDSGEINCVTTAHAAGVGSVVVTDSAGKTGTLFLAYTYAVPPTVSSISPTSASTDGGDTVTISGSGFKSGATVTLKGVNCGSVSILFSNSLTCRTGRTATAGLGNVVVTNPDDQIGTKTNAFTYVAPPTVADIEPSAGALGGGTLVTITGSNFVTGATVKLGNTTCTSPTVLSSSTITCITGARSSGTVSVKVYNPDGQMDSQSAAYTYQSAPNVTSISPTSGLTSGNTTITVNGSSFRTGITAMVGNAACTSLNLNSSSKLTCITPSNVAGVYNVRVTNSDNQTDVLSNAYTYFNPNPTLTSISPTMGVLAGGTSVTLTGTGFLSGATVSLGGSVCANVVINSSTQLTCTTSAHSAGLVSVTITNSDAKFATLSNSYTYRNPAPTIASVSPNSGLIAGGNNLTINGSGFIAGAGVIIGGNSCGSVSVVSGTQISCVAPVHASGSVSVQVTNTDLQSVTLNNAYTYINPPTLSSVSPQVGPLSGGTTITLTGTAFQTGAAVYVGGNLCNGINVASATQISCTTPPHAAGLVSIQVTNPDLQSSTLNNAFLYQTPAPQLTSISPNEGTSAGGTTVVIQGSGFLSGIAVMVGGQACTSVNVVSSSQIQCVTQAHAAGSVNLYVANTDGQNSTLANAFNYITPPVISSISPQRGITNGGTTLTISGTGFATGASVSLGSQSCMQIQVVSSTEINCVTGAAAAGTVDVIVTNPDALASILSQSFTFETNWIWKSGSRLVNQLPSYGTKGMAAATNMPGARDSSTSWADSSNNLWLFGGFGLDSMGNQGSLSDLWKFDGVNWTWIAGSNSVDTSGVYGTKGVSSASNHPGARTNAISWSDSHDNFWIFGGYGADSTGSQGFINDLWKFDGTNWTWVSGSKFCNQMGNYGTLGLTDPANIPGARGYSIAWRDSQDNLWIFGGYASDATGSVGDMNDLWKFDGTNWTWISGSRFVRQRGTYGTMNSYSLLNVPGARDSAHAWRDSSNNLWLFGGYGLDTNGNAGDLNDLWKFDGTYWVWVSGSSTKGQAGSYGTRGIGSVMSTPGARDSSLSWIDSSNNLWLFGGFGVDANATNGILSDLWKFDGTNWIWVNGSNMKNLAGEYGTLNTPSLTNSPGSRGYSVQWIDSSNNLWIFGGYGMDDNGTGGDLNDLWLYTP